LGLLKLGLTALPILHGTNQEVAATVPLVPGNDAIEAVRTWAVIAQILEFRAVAFERQTKTGTSKASTARWRLSSRDSAAAERTCVQT